MFVKTNLCHNEHKYLRKWQFSRKLRQFHTRLNVVTNNFVAKTNLVLLQNYLKSADFGQVDYAAFVYSIPNVNKKVFKKLSTFNSLILHIKTYFFAYLIPPILTGQISILKTRATGGLYFIIHANLRIEALTGAN